jgi:hypothetical protein
MIATKPTQLDLLPPKPLKVGAVEDVQVDRLPASADLWSEPPSHDLVESIRAWGVLEPVLVRAAGGALDYSDPSALIAGRRRIKAVRVLQAEYREAVQAAARASGLATHDDLSADPTYRKAYEQLARFYRIPCRVLSDPEGERLDGRTALLGLASNALRRDNPAGDFVQIRDLLDRFVRAGLSERKALTEVARATGLKVATIKQRLRLMGLTAGLLDDFLAGAIPYSVALAASKLSPDAQATLEALSDAGGRITLEAVGDARKSAVREVQQVLFDALPPGELRALGGGDPLPLAIRAQEAVATLRSTRLPVCLEAATIIAELLEADDDRRVDAENRSLND